MFVTHRFRFKYERGLITMIILYIKRYMKKFFIIVLTFILVLGMFNVVVANNLVDNIKQELNEIEGNITRNEPDAAKQHLFKLRDYVYEWAAELTKQNLYTERVMDIIGFAAKGVEENNIEYIEKARSILEEIISGKNIVVKNNHS